MRRIFIITVLFFLPIELTADYTCQSEVSYTWKKDEVEKKVIYKTIYADFNSEDQGKIELRREAERAKADANSDCSRNHENLANCIVSKLKNLAGTSAGLGFKSKAMLEAAVEQDCKLQTGICLSASFTEVTCQKNLADVEPSPSPSPEEEKGKKK